MGSTRKHVYHTEDLTSRHSFFDTLYQHEIGVWELTGRQPGREIGPTGATSLLLRLVLLELIKGEIK